MINKKYEPLVFSLVMSVFMNILMSGVISFINLGFVDNFFIIWTEAFLKAFVIAFPVMLILVPQVRKIVSLLINKE